MFKSLFLLLATLFFAGAARILAYFPSPARSHHFFYQPTIVELGRRGHAVDYFSPFPLRIREANVTWIRLDDFSELYFRPDVPEPWFDFLQTPNDRALMKWLTVAVDHAESLCDSSAFQVLLQSNRSYDLILHEGLTLNEIGNVFAHKFNALSVTFAPISDAFYLNEMTGLVTNPSFMVSSITSFSDEMSFFERVVNAYSYWTFTFLAYAHYLNEIQRVADKCYTYPGWENRPSIRELAKDQSLVLANSLSAAGGPYPRAPHWREVSGGGIIPRQPLPQDLNDFMNGARDGVIYFSLGTIVNLEASGNQLKEAFMAAFAERKERILWKWGGKPVENSPKNIKFSRFLPQQDILRHPNLKIFITHAGLQSAFEGVYFAVPLIFVPVFGDQLKNSMSLEKLGCGIRLDLNNITATSLGWAIEEISRPKYRAAVEKTSALLRDRPMEPVKEAAYWIEYVLKHGKVLQPAAVRQSTIEFHRFDVYAFILTVLLLVSSSLKYLVEALTHKFHRKSSSR